MRHFLIIFLTAASYLCLAQLANSETPSVPSQIEQVTWTEAPNNPNVVGYVVWYNEWTLGPNGDHPIVLETSVGPIQATLTITANNYCGLPCPDFLSITSIPDGYLISSLSAELPEGEQMVFELIPYVGF